METGAADPSLPEFWAALCPGLAVSAGPPAARDDTVPCVHRSVSPVSSIDIFAALTHVHHATPRGFSLPDLDAQVCRRYNKREHASIGSTCLHAHASMCALPRIELLAITEAASDMHVCEVVVLAAKLHARAPRAA